MRRGVILKVWYKSTYIVAQPLTGCIVMYPRRIALDDGVGVDEPPFCAGNEGDLVLVAVTKTDHGRFQNGRPGNNAHHYDT